LDLGALFACKFNFEDSLESRAVILLARADGAGNFAMRPRERRESGKQDLFRSRLDQIIDMNHALAKLARAIDWRFLEERFGALYSDKPGQPPLPTRLMAGLAILKHSYDLSDEALCDRWVENPYFQYFCGEEFFQHVLVFDRSSLTRWRQRMGEEKLQALLQESLAVATRTQAMKPSNLARVVIDTTVQPKAVMFPTDAKLLNRARERLVRLAKKLGRTHHAPSQRSMNAQAGRDPRDAQRRLKRAQKILSQMLTGASILQDSVFPGMKLHEHVPDEDRVGMPIPADYFRLIAAKIVRGIFYIEDQKFIEPPYVIDFYTFVPNDEVAAQFEAWLIQYGIIYAREPGLVVHRAVTPEDGLTSLFKITFWEQLSMYATVTRE